MYSHPLDDLVAEAGDLGVGLFVRRIFLLHGLGLSQPGRGQVPRLSRSAEERNARLKALMHRVPEGTGLPELVHELMGPPNSKLDLPTPAQDRHAAIVGAACVEHGLRRAITLHLKSDLSAKEAKALFEDYQGPMSSFSDRIAIASALGIVDDATAKDLTLIRQIRNTFAHSVLPITFGNSEIASLVADIQKIRDDLWSLYREWYARPRDIYVVNCAIHHAALDIYRWPDPKRTWTAKDYLVEALRAG